MSKSALYFVNIKLRFMMLRTLYMSIVCLSLVSACNALQNSSQPKIALIKTSVIKVPLSELFPSQKGGEKIRTLLEISFASNSDIFSQSLVKGMSLRATVGFCEDFYHIPGLAFPSIHYKGKTIEYYLINDSVPEVINSEEIIYKVYINFLEYKKVVEDNAEAKLCLQVSGASYVSSFESNIIRIKELEINGVRAELNKDKAVQ